MKNIVLGFDTVRLAMSRTFLITLLGKDYSENNPWHNASCLPVKWDGMAIPNPTSTAEANYYEQASILICSHILATFPGVNVF